MRKVVSLLSALVVVVLLVAPSASAHTGAPASAYWEFLLPNGNAVFSEPYAEWGGTGTIAKFDLTWSPFSGPADITGIEAQLLNADGSPYSGSWTRLNNAAGTSNWFTLGTGGGTAHATATFAANSATAVRFRICSENNAVVGNRCGGATEIIYGKAQTSTAGIAPNAPALGCSGTFDGVGLEWTHSGIAATGFTIQRAVAASGSWSDVHTAGASVRAWEDRPQASHLARDYRIRTSNGPSNWSNTCTATTAETTTGEDIPTPDVTDPGPGEDEGESCAIWNIFCHFVKAGRFLFVPGSTTTDAWASLQETAATRPPFSVVLGGLDDIDELLDCFNDNWSGAILVTCGSSGAGGTQSPNFMAAMGRSGSMTIDWFTTLEEMRLEHETLFRVARGLLGLGVVAGTMFHLWRSARANVGDKFVGGGTDERPEFEE